MTASKNMASSFFNFTRMATGTKLLLIQKFLALKFRETKNNLRMTFIFSHYMVGVKIAMSFGFL